MWTPRFWKALGLVVSFSLLVWAAEALRQPSDRDWIRVRPDADGLVRVDIGDLGKLEVRFYRFLNSGNQEVLFLVGRDEFGQIQVGFDAGESHSKLRRGFSYQDGFVVDNKCGTTSRLSTLNEGGSGCKPIPLRHRVAEDQLVLTENDLLQGWRYFR